MTDHVPPTPPAQIVRAVAVLNLVMAYLPIVLGLAKGGSIGAAEAAIVTVITLTISGGLFFIARAIDRRAARRDAA